MRMKVSRKNEAYVDEQDTIFEQRFQGRQGTEDLIHHDEEEGTESVLNTWFGRSFQIEEDDADQQAQHDRDHDLRDE